MGIPFFLKNGLGLKHEDTYSYLGISIHILGFPKAIIHAMFEVS